MPHDNGEKAMQFAIKYERRRTGETPDDVSREGRGYDLESKDRLIEVKGTDHVNGGLVISLYKKLLTKLGKDIVKYHIYLIYDMRREPKLKILTPEFIFA
ncbi:MAG TPA: DUF3883 domain-containing protein, partial [Candidatus Paceibacterota bacterium]|nr:DUF3883 domain-containing protein [Candidatus Paceibacterota bacterium]